MVLYGLGRPGKLLLPGPCLLVPANSSCRGLHLGPASSSCRGLRLGCLVFSWRFPGRPLPRGAATAREQVGVLSSPYFSTPTGAPGTGPHTVPSVVGPGPNSARARVAWVSRTGKKEAYLDGDLCGRWEEWRAEWCLIVEDHPQPFTVVRRI